MFWILVVALGLLAPDRGFGQVLDRAARGGAVTMSEEQSTSSPRAISGTLLDPTGAAIVNAQVSLLGSGDKALAQVTTDNSGSFRFDHLDTGNYILDFQAEGFRPTRVNVNLTVKRQTPIRVTMQLAVLNESITVAIGDSAPLVSIESSENQNANTIDRNALDRVPVFDQDYITT
ncbi:MAG TPA: carboxypeptidase-like regulatory domain-containing protein, partial [Candidatus Acidoferrum sp.]|nr:carboxypeptidase-like regulatory domain-containing protein [Candidatus Acidoferrum sp.]